MNGLTVTVFDGPEVVRTGFGLTVLHIGFGFVQVDGGVVHHRADEACFVGEARVCQFCGGMKLRGFHVVHEAEGMSHFVEHEVVNGFVDQARFLSGCGVLSIQE